MSKETWKDVVGYEGVYQVSNHGRVKRIGHARGATPGRILKPAQNLKGYLHVSLSRSQKRRDAEVHRLVAEAFLWHAPSPDHEVNHKNGNKQDNRVENLEWVTRCQNVQHSVRQLHADRAKGEENGHAKATAREVRRIRQLYASGKYSHMQLGEMFGLGHTTIGAIVRRETWKHVQ
jgi:hypothetical protein